VRRQAARLVSITHADSNTIMTLYETCYVVLENTIILPLLSNHSADSQPFISHICHYIIYMLSPLTCHVDLVVMSSQVAVGEDRHGGRQAGADVIHRVHALGVHEPSETHRHFLQSFSHHCGERGGEYRVCSLSFSFFLFLSFCSFPESYFNNTAVEHWVPAACRGLSPAVRGCAPRVSGALHALRVIKGSSV